MAVVCFVSCPDGCGVFCVLSRRLWCVLCVVQTAVVCLVCCPDGWWDAQLAALSTEAESDRVPGWRRACAVDEADAMRSVRARLYEGAFAVLERVGRTDGALGDVRMRIELLWGAVNRPGDWNIVRAWHSSSHLQPHPLTRPLRAYTQQQMWGPCPKLIHPVLISVYDIIYD
jgi:hypothetical protein